MYDADGVGLAAPQVGVLKRCVVIDVGDGLIELVNPEIIATEGAVVGAEGCLSIPGRRCTVERPEKVTVHRAEPQRRIHSSWRPRACWRWPSATRSTIWTAFCTSTR